MVNILTTTLFGLNGGGGKENNTMTILISLFINSIQKKGRGEKEKNQELQKQVKCNMEAY